VLKQENHFQIVSVKYFREYLSIHKKNGLY